MKFNSKIIKDAVRRKIIYIQPGLKSIFNTTDTPLGALHSTILPGLRFIGVYRNVLCILSLYVHKAVRNKL